MTDSPIVKIVRDPLLSRTIAAAVIADGLLLLPFFLHPTYLVKSYLQEIYLL
jgi:hypothetical protein